MSEDNDRGKTLSWEEWLERTDVEISEERPASEILKEWRQHRQLSPTNCFDCGLKIDTTDCCVQASWTYFEGETELGTGFVTYCTDCIPPE